MDPLILLSQTEFIAFDLETTGLSTATSEIVEIGAVRFRGDGEVLGQFQQLVDPQCHIPLAATRVHGISRVMVKGQPLIAEVLPRFLEFLGEASAVLLAHNAGFDLGFLSTALVRLGLPFPLHQTVDTCTLARKKITLFRNNLESLGRHFQLATASAHRALEDALLLKQVFERLSARPPVLRTLADLYALSAPRAFESRASQLQKPPQGFESLWDAMAKRLALEIRYSGGSRPGRLRRITPRNVLKMRGSIYLSAYCHEGKCDKTFRLDRIQSYRTLSADNSAT